MNINILEKPPIQAEFDAEIIKANEKIRRNRKNAAIIGFFLTIVSGVVLIGNNITTQTELNIQIGLTLLFLVNCKAFSTVVVSLGALAFSKRNITIESGVITLYLFIIMQSGLIGNPPNILLTVMYAAFIASLCLLVVELIKWLSIDGPSKHIIYNMSSIEEETYIEIQKYIKVNEIAQYCEKVGLQNRSIKNIELREMKLLHIKQERNKQDAEINENARIAKETVFNSNET